MDNINIVKIIPEKNKTEKQPAHMFFNVANRRISRGLTCQPVRGRQPAGAGKYKDVSRWVPHII